MSTLTIQSCLKAGFYPPKGSRAPILIPIAIATLFIMSVFLGYFLSGTHDHYIATLLKHSNRSPIEFIGFEFLVKFIEILLFQPVFTGILLFTLRAQRQGATPKKIGLLFAFKGYRYLPSLLGIILIYTVLSTLIITFTALMIPNLNTWVSQLTLTLIGLFTAVIAITINLAQLFITDKQYSFFQSIQCTLKNFFTLKHFFTIVVSLFLFTLYLAITLIPFELGLALINQFPESLGYLAFSMMIISLSLVWFTRAFTGLIHVIVHPYATIIPLSSVSRQA